ncbi:respiratory chain complex I subunit 1 family protein [Streptomyces malaysiensis subsp. malaysiensis]
MSTAVEYAAVVGQVVVVGAGAPLVTGWMRQVRARLEGRAGAGVFQPWRDARKLMRKEPITPVGTGPAFRTAPALLVATAVVAAALVPLLSTDTPVSGHADLIVVVALIALGTMALALAGLDTGTAFGGMGASREMTVAALVEPTILLSVFALSIPAGTTNIPAIVSGAANEPARLASPAGLLATAALAVAVLAETGRIPVDNPSTHLELTMIHEAMVLEYAGPDLALVELGAQMRLTLLLGLLSSLVVPWGIATGASWAALALALVLFAAKVCLLGAVLAAAEVFWAKIRLFRVPELLAGSFLLALLAVTASYFLGERHERRPVHPAPRPRLRCFPAGGRDRAVAARTDLDRPRLRATGPRTGRDRRPARRARGTLGPDRRGARHRGPQGGPPAVSDAARPGRAHRGPAAVR